ncbi:VOC family protein [Psychromonas sp. SR45-3]|uniref:VOC family protein n=1 Tax=Psychromonas sp. SR45-3 TaxID=2760930 RepID=UPI0015F78896|nr:VOC family protein [Psychromonas sp. SR45-3]MBB1273526.1 VOC family protein [Psychromonas sp. SR45-3]
MSMNPVGWFEIYVDDLARAKTFYEAVFEVNLEVLGDPNESSIQMLAFPSDMEKYGATGALVKMDHVIAGGGGTLVYFACDDCAIEAARAKTAGGSIQRPKMDIGEYGFICLVLDSEGNMIGLHSMN